MKKNARLRKTCVDNVMVIHSFDSTMAKECRKHFRRGVRINNLLQLHMWCFYKTRDYHLTHIESIITNNPILTESISVDRAPMSLRYMCVEDCDPIGLENDFVTKIILCHMNPKSPYQELMTAWMGFI